MGKMENEFAERMEAFMVAEGWQPSLRTGASRRQYFGEDRVREWIQSDFCAILRGVPRNPTVIGELDTAPADFEHNVAKYLWWVSKRKPFWEVPTILVSAFAEPGSANCLLHENIGRYLGGLLESAVPGTHHVIVGVRGEPRSFDVGQRLAERSIEAIKPL